MIIFLWLVEEYNGVFFKKKLLIDRVFGMSDLKDFVNKILSFLKVN